MYIELNGIATICIRGRVTSITQLVNKSQLMTKTRYPYTVHIYILHYSKILVTKKMKNHVNTLIFDNVFISITSLGQQGLFYYGCVKLRMVHSSCDDVFSLASFQGNILSDAVWQNSIQTKLLSECCLSISLFVCFLNPLSLL